MTRPQIDELFATLTYNEARKHLREEARRLGREITGNESRAELIAKALDLGAPNTSQSDGSAASEGESGGTPPPPPASAPEAAPAPSEARPATDLEKEMEDAASELKKAEAAANESRRKMEELVKEAKRRAEEAKKKAEEAERKRKEQAGGEHEATDELLRTLKVTGIAYLVGPAGTGKSTMAMGACERLFEVKRESPDFFKKFAQISFSPDTTSAEMIGRCDINGNFHESEVVRVFRDGGVILFDEIDDADSAMLIKLNTAIANGYIATPKGMVRRNKNTYIVTTANTYGTGPDAMYVGRTRLDAATLDRFVCSTIEVDYSKALEDKITSALPEGTKAGLLTFVNKVRTAIKTSHLRRLCSTRFVVNATKWLLDGAKLPDVMAKLMIGWTEAERKAVGV